MSHGLADDRLDRLLQLNQVGMRQTSLQDRSSLAAMPLFHCAV